MRWGQCFRGRHGGVETRGGWKTSRMTPLPKRGFGPSPRTVRFPPPSGISARSKIHDRADQRLFWRGPKKYRESLLLWYVFLPPYVLHPPISRPKVLNRPRPGERLTNIGFGHVPRRPSFLQYRTGAGKCPAPPPVLDRICGAWMQEFCPALDFNPLLPCPGLKPILDQKKAQGFSAKPPIFHTLYLCRAFPTSACLCFGLLLARSSTL